MKMLKRVSIFLMFDWDFKLLVIEALFFLGWARILKKSHFQKWHQI